MNDPEDLPGSVVGWGGLRDLGTFSGGLIPRNPLDQESVGELIRA